MPGESSSAYPKVTEGVGVPGKSSSATPKQLKGWPATLNGGGKLVVAMRHCTRCMSIQLNIAVHVQSCVTIAYSKGKHQNCLPYHVKIGRNIL